MFNSQRLINLAVASKPEIRARSALIAERNSVESWFSDPAAVASNGPTFLYDADVTTAWHREWCRSLLAELDKPLAQRAAPQPRSLWNGAGLGRYLHNPTGRILLDIAMPDLLSIASREDLLVARHAGQTAALSGGAEGDDGLGGRLRLEGDELVGSLDGEEVGGKTARLRWKRLD